ncbi:MAG TPA: NAD(P)H-dependent oxidoreductase, partial [Kribbella sp.]
MSRTRAAAELIAEKLTGTAPTAVIDVVDLGAGLLGWGDPAVAEAKKTVLAADALIVASPTYKATYTG